MTRVHCLRDIPHVDRLAHRCHQLINIGAIAFSTFSFLNVVSWCS